MSLQSTYKKVKLRGPGGAGVFPILYALDRGGILPPPLGLRVFSAKGRAGAPPVKAKWGGGVGAEPPPSSYLEFTSQKVFRALRIRSCMEDQRTYALLEAPVERCKAQVKTATCLPGGHKIGKVLVCGREWCPTCRQSRSEAHMRRYARWLPKLQQVRSLGQIVITWPQESRHLLEDRDTLKQLGKEAVTILKQWGFLRGLRRWHWYGGQEGVYHPHLNLLFDGGFLPKAQLKALKGAFLALSVPARVVHYSYTTQPGKMIHRARYITRATFTNWRWNPALALALRGFRNTCWWGYKRWQESAVWSLDQFDQEEAQALQAIFALAAGACPICGGKIRWGPVETYDRKGALGDLGAGIVQLRAPPP